MNIPKITPYNFGASNQINNTTKVNNNLFTGFGLRMTSPIKQDTVSFQGTAKVMEAIDCGLPTFKDAISVANIAKKRQELVKKFLHSNFAKYVYNEFEPKNLLTEIKDRPKTAGSIWEKSNTRKWSSIQVCLQEMTDLNGGKLIMRDSSTENVDKIYDILIDLIERGKLELVEVEQKRPGFLTNLSKNKRNKYDYGSTEKLIKMCDVASKRQGKKIELSEPDYRDSNYVATHFLLRLPNQDWVFELQLMGEHTAFFKDLDDIIYKILGGKKVHDAYKDIETLINTELTSSSDIEKFKKYRADAFIFQRKKEPSRYVPKEKKTSQYLLTLQSDLSSKLDLNELLKMKHKDDMVKEQMDKVLEKKAELQRERKASKRAKRKI